MFTKEMKEIIKMIISAFLVAMVITGITHCLTFNKAIEQVRKETIEEAILVSCDEDGYTLSFGGELHNYSFN